MDITTKVENEVKDCITKYKLLKKTDKVLVALSGGKDSVSLLYILYKLGYKVQALMIDLNLGEYSKIHNAKMKKFCEELNVPLTIVKLKDEIGHDISVIKEILRHQKNLSGCTVCGTLKRWILNRKAKEMKVDKLVTGHNLDDETQNVLMNFLKGNIYLGVNSSPMTGNPNTKGFIQRVKPFFFTAENDIRKYFLAKEFDILDKPCPCAYKTYRIETRQWMSQITDKEKLKIVQGLQNEIPKLKKQETKELKFCKICGEPASSEICNTCKMMSHLK